MKRDEFDSIARALSNAIDLFTLIGEEISKSINVDFSTNKFRKLSEYLERIRKVNKDR